VTRAFWKSARILYTPPRNSAPKSAYVELQDLVAKSVARQATSSGGVRQAAVGDREFTMR
jgi:hypothetical protein